MEKLKNIENLQPSQIIKHYFSEYSAKMRKQMEKTLLCDDLSVFNDRVYTYYQSIQEQVKKDTPILLNSIILNSLGYEYNEQLKKTCYMDYYNKNISRFAKPFINGQYQIFRNDNEKLLGENARDTEETIIRIEEVIKLLVEIGVDGTLNLKDTLEAYKIDKSSIDGIVKKILKYNK